MANEEHLAILRQGVEVWNAWREAYHIVRVDLQGADLQGAYLLGADLQGADLHGAHVQTAHLEWADLRHTDFRGAHLQQAFLQGADLGGALLTDADLMGAILIEANLRDVDLQEANLRGAHFQRADLQGAHLEGAHFEGTHLRAVDIRYSVLNSTIFANTDLSEVKGLETVHHTGPSEISISTLYKSQGNIPEAFLRGCGVPDSMVEYLPSLINAMQPIQFYSCFISYSTKDDDFAKRLHSRMQQEHMRVWFAPEELKGGHKLRDQIDDAIRIYDKLLLILSEASMASDWVAHEIRGAHNRERAEGKRVLFPIRLCDFKSLTDWELHDGPRDLAREVRDYHIPDFSHWNDHDAFEAAFAQLLKPLRADENVP